MKIIDFLAYNVWANSILGKLVEGININDFNLVLTSSFPTINKTLLHILDAETIWLKRLQGKSLTYWPSEQENISKEKAIEMLIGKSLEFKTFMNNQPSNYVDGTCNFKDTKGNEYSIAVADIVQHVCNHSTFHRGQIIAMLRQVGFTNLKSTDYITWIRQGKA